LRGSAVLTFVLALAAFIAVGAGVAVVALPASGAGQAGPRPARSTPADAAASPTPAADGATAPSDGEYPLLENVTAIARPDQPGRIVIPSIALDQRVVEVGVVMENGKPVWDTAAYAVGFHRGTAQPGTRGNAVMAGHISSPVSRKGEAFRRLPEVRIGDRVFVYIGERRAGYEISEIRVLPPTATQVMAPTADAVLTLITCYPDQDYSRRLVVVGRLVEAPS
jgi:sortase A